MEIFIWYERTKVNYKPLWKILIDRDMSKAQNREEASISRSTVFKMVNNEYGCYGCTGEELHGSWLRNG